MREKLDGLAMLAAIESISSLNGEGSLNEKVTFMTLALGSCTGIVVLSNDEFERGCEMSFRAVFGSKPRLCRRLAQLFVLGLVLTAPFSGIAQESYGVPPFISSGLAYHHHPLFRIVFYDSSAENSPFPRLIGMRTPPTNLGITAQDKSFRFREIHTHEGTSGTLHVESPNPVKKYKLGEFFALWISEDPRIELLLEQIKEEGTVYLFDFVKANQTYLTTVVANDDFLDLPLDDDRHIVIYMPGEAQDERPMVPAG